MQEPRIRGRSRHRKTRKGLWGRRYGISFCLFLALLAATCILFGYPHSQTDGDTVLAEEKTLRKDIPDTLDEEKWRELLHENRISEEFREGLGVFAFESAAHLLRQGQGNINYSPLSAYYALTLAGCGAEGETAKEIFSLLQAESREELIRQCQKLYQWFYYSGQWAQRRGEYYGGTGTDGGDAVKIGNSVWVSESVKLEREYQKLVSGQFFAPCLSVDFKSPKTGENMGEWIAQNTNRAVFAPIFPDSENRVSILNTLYFYGGWRERFAQKDTKEDIFTLADGDRQSCLFLNQTIESGSFRKEDGFTLSCLRTADCEVVFLLPDEGRRPEDFLGSSELLEAVMSPDRGEWVQGEITWQIPRFSFESSMDLRSLFQAMGIEKMFGESAEFDSISRDPLWISDMVQETFISVDENGVEGAAYTIMQTEAAAIEEERPVHVDMILNRPFLYGIRTNEGIWLFLGIYRRPEGFS